MPSLTVLIDHIAGLRQNMQAATPDPVAAAILAELAGADLSASICARTAAMSRTAISACCGK